MTRRYHSNNFVTTLNGDISSGATSIVITSATGFPTVGSGATANVTIANGSTIEIVTCTARSGTTLTVTRGAEGTTPSAFVSGSTVSIRPTADSVDRKMDEDSYTTTATAAGTTTLTVDSNRKQFFTGSTTQTVVLPVTSTLALGRSFIIVNNSSGVVTVQSSGANTIVAMAAATWAEFTCILTSGTGTASWDYKYHANASGITGTGSGVRATSPTLVTPVLGAASATSLSFSSTSGIIGTTTNNNAAAGSVGEFIESQITYSGHIALTSNTAINVTSISLTAGDWEVWGLVCFDGAGTTTVQNVSGWISLTSATQPADPTNYFDLSFGATATLKPFDGAYISYPVAPIRLSLASTTTVYFSALAVFAVSTCSAFGRIGARRLR